ncbi:hypothetical protein CIG75_10940 [Tumebacillus algifaecis]|uniref:Uncharacterized protein n=1 Tax=Tumebacillus algifaecis TaxID=1214604 RepID=A0A223D106_9BACL|nr:hypothetical protein [Tumebacillus algifaecis]ASS75439.1 hypothetical protein CIG75_10940 [Tumebacillus algifaecis]
MLNFLLIAAVVYLLYTWGVRLQMRAQLFGQAWSALLGYACSLAAGTAASLFVTMSVMERLWPDASVLAVSFISTVLSAMLGEYLHARSFRLSLLMIAPLRSKESKR